MDEWLKRVAAAVGSDEQLSGEDADALLKIARIAAHESDDRRNAPLLCYLIGRMQTDAVPIIEIPASALTRINQQSAVWIVDPDKRTVSMRNVDVLRFDQAKVVVSHGLDTGEIVVTAGVQALHPGQKIRLLGSER